MDEQSRAQEVKDILKSFLKMFNEYAQEVYGGRLRLNELRGNLQRQEPKVTRYILDILGDAAIDFGRGARISRGDLLSNSLLGGNNAMPHNFRHYEAFVTDILNRAIGAIEAGLWPPKEPTPVLVIKDDELRQRCSDLLSASGNYDRVIREATTVLEDRIRNKCPHAVLARLIPQSADQSGENLVNKIFAPDNPVLSISDNKNKRIAFHRIMLGVISYLRNPSHHRLDPSTEWSWAWSTVGFIDTLLLEINSCVVVGSAQP